MRPLLMVAGRVARLITALVAAQALLAGIAQAQEPTARCVLRETWRHGAVDGPQSLTTVSAVLPSLNQSLLYVAQARDQSIRIVSVNDGQTAGAFGRRGSGPGEFQTLSRLTWRSDTLVVSDKVQQRLSLFSADGTHLRSELIASPALPDMRRPAVAVAIDPEGGAWGEPFVDMMRIANRDASGYPIVRLSRTGGVLTRLATVNMENAMASADYGTGVAVFVQPLSQWSVREYAPDGSSVIIVDMPRPDGADGVFFVSRISFNGDTTFRRAFNYRPHPVSARQRDSIYDAYSVNFSRGNTQQQARRVAREYVTVPRTPPPVSGIVIGVDGRIWLRREELDRSGMWLVLDERGSVEGTCAVPPGVRLLAAAERRAWGVWQDEFDVPYVVQFDVVF